jgi:predicted nuclease of predicted toxin-antitoxin system
MLHKKADWEIWLDVNISPIIAKWISEQTIFTAKSTFTLNHQTLNDLEIYERARKNGNIILISKDTDFPELITKLGSPPKLIYLNIGNCNNIALWNTIHPILEKAVDQLVNSEVDIIELN